MHNGEISNLVDQTNAQSAIGERCKSCERKVRPVVKSKAAKEWMVFEEIPDVAETLLRKTAKEGRYEDIFQL